MKKQILSIISMALVGTLSPHSFASSKPQFADRGSIYPLALQGSLKTVLDEYRKVEAHIYSDSGQDLREAYLVRFGGDIPNSVSLSGIAGQVLLAYQKYWWTVLREDLAVEEGYRYWYSELSKIAVSLGADPGPFEEKEAERIVALLQARLKDEGYYSQIGRTSPHMDLLLWKVQEEKSYSIDLGDTAVEVPVVMMDHFESLGWLGYATFNDKAVGGWATKHSLFCVKPRYDLESESFKVSYLSHEGRHFSDYKRFPLLGSIDLEYRAKLTELSLAQKTLMDLFVQFTNEADKDSQSGHGVASYHVVTDLANELDVELSELKQNPAVYEIRKAATSLIDIHNRKLDELGAKSAQGTFHQAQ